MLELKEADFDPNLTGFDTKELDDLLTGVDDEQADIVHPCRNKFDHPTQKPVELMRRPILNHTRRGELV